MKLKIIIFAVLFIGHSLNSYPQDNADSLKTDYKTEIENYRTGQNIKMLYSDGSPLTAEQRKDFKGLLFFTTDEKYIIEAAIDKTPSQKSVILKTSTEREPEYLEYGKITFLLDGKQYSLTAYQSKKLTEVKKEIDYVFVPFRDVTSGKESYKGGRYIDCKLPTEGNIIVIDFNKAYNPYCAYNPKYSCVIPPEENHLPVRIEAGEKVFEKH